MYLNTLICLEENVTGYGKNGAQVTGHITITSPGIVKCYVQNLRQLPKEYTVYLMSKDQNKAVRLGSMNVCEGNKQVTWKVDLNNIKGAGVKGTDIDSAAVVVEGDSIGNTDTVLIGYTAGKYLITSMLESALPKKSSPVPKPMPKPVQPAQSKPVPKVEPTTMVMPQPQPKQECGPEPEGGPGPVIIPQPQPEPEGGPGPVIMPQPQPVGGPGPVIIPQPQPEPEGGPGPVIVPQPQPEPVGGPGPVIVPQPQQEYGSGPVIKPQSQPKQECGPGPVITPKPQPKQECGPEPVIKPQSQPKQECEPGPVIVPQPKQECGPVPVIVPKPQPKQECKPVPVIMPQPESKPAPAIMPEPVILPEVKAGKCDADKCDTDKCDADKCDTDKCECKIYVPTSEEGDVTEVEILRGLQEAFARTQDKSDLAKKVERIISESVNPIPIPTPMRPINNKADEEEAYLSQIESVLKNIQNNIGEELQEKKTPLEDDEVSIYKRDIARVRDIFNDSAAIEPFAEKDAHIDWVRISMSELISMPQLSYEWCTNPVITYCYHKFGFLILGRDKDIEQYYVGIPDIYDTKREFILSIDKIEAFRGRTDEQLKPGDYGYWIVRL